MSKFFKCLFGGNSSLEDFSDEPSNETKKKKKDKKEKNTSKISKNTQTLGSNEERSNDNTDKSTNKKKNKNKKTKTNKYKHKHKHKNKKKNKNKNKKKNKNKNKKKNKKKNKNSSETEEKNDKKQQKDELSSVDFVDNPNKQKDRGQEKVVSARSPRKNPNYGNLQQLTIKSTPSTPKKNKKNKNNIKKGSKKKSLSSSSTSSIATVSSSEEEEEEKGKTKKQPTATKKKEKQNKKDKKKKKVRSITQTPIANKKPNLQLNLGLVGNNLVNKGDTDSNNKNDQEDENAKEDDHNKNEKDMEKKRTLSAKAQLELLVNVDNVKKNRKKKKKKKIRPRQRPKTPRAGAIYKGFEKTENKPVKSKSFINNPEKINLGRINELDSVSEMPSETEIENKLLTFFEKFNVDPLRRIEISKMKPFQKWKIINLQGDSSDDLSLEETNNSEKFETVSNNRMEFMREFILSSFSIGKGDTQTKITRKKFINNQYKNLQEKWSLLTRKILKSFSETVISLLNDILTNEQLGLIYFVLSWFPKTPFSFSSQRQFLPVQQINTLDLLVKNHSLFYEISGIVNKEHKIVFQNNSALITLIFVLAIDIVNQFYELSEKKKTKKKNKSLQSQISNSEPIQLEPKKKKPFFDYPRTIKDYELTIKDFKQLIKIVNNKMFSLNFKESFLALITRIANSVLVEKEMNEYLELFRGEIAQLREEKKKKLQKIINHVLKDIPLILPNNRINSRYLREGMILIKLMSVHGKLEEILVRKQARVSNVIDFFIHKFENDLSSYAIYSSNIVGQWSNFMASSINLDFISSSSSSSGSGSSSSSSSNSNNSEDNNSEKKDKKNNKKGQRRMKKIQEIGNSVNINSANPISIQSQQLFDHLTSKKYLENGEFLKKNTKIYKYKNKKLLLRKLVPDTVDIFLPSYFSNLKKTWATFETSLPVTKIVNILTSNFTVSSNTFGIVIKGEMIFDKIQKKENDNDNGNINKDEEMGMGNVKGGCGEVVGGEDELQDKRMSKRKKKIKNFPFFEIDNSTTQLEVYQQIETRMSVFGYWVPSNSEKKFSYYYDQAMIRGLENVKFQHKPGQIGLILPNNKKIKLIIDFNINVVEFIECLKLYYKFDDFAKNKKKIKNQKQNNKIIKYMLLFVEYKIDEKTEEKNVSELLLLKKNKNLSEQGVTTGSVLKFVRVERELVEENDFESNNESSELNNKKISDDLRFWTEYGLDVKNIAFDNKNKNKNKNKNNEKGGENETKGGENDEGGEKGVDFYETVRGASFNKSIEILTNPKYYHPRFLDIFYESLQTFSSVEFFMKKLFEKFEIPDVNPKTKKKFSTAEKESNQLMILKLIVIIMKHRGASLSNEVKNIVLNFARNVLILNQSEEIGQQGMFIELLSTRKNRVKPIKNWKTFEDIENKTKFTQKKLKAPTKYPKFKELDDLTIFDIKVDDIAKILSIFGQNLLTKIKTNELLDLAWTQKNKKEISPNVISLIERFNWLADWASTMILKAEDDKQRTKILIKLIDIALKLQSLNNYNDVMALMGGLEGSAVSRLENTWKRLPNQYMEAFRLLSKLTNAIGGYQELRKAYNESPLPMVPFIGVFLSDLVYIEELPNRIEGNLINWAKKRRIYDVIRFIKKCQAVKYNFVYFRIVKQFLERDPVLTENEMWDYSVKIEPPNW
ncbi:guanine nucleotide exchange factor [Anaeramoeba flamelloides]|uniref:Guanine nucleotide exchange factor n=1 Tax=Anaeramoeba flamelloides TaxID=1746091 RepID=A0ABQ8Z302_9EUKA|nr:guanine nucleotide exchange factor [Anaeramoeba flamelloides]